MSGLEEVKASSAAVGSTAPPFSAPADSDSIDVSGDGCVLKKILVKGEGAAPEKHHEVSVHYTGTLLDGTKFDSSRDRGNTFDFQLGAGEVIKGWDVGVATMKVGERSLFTIAPSYAYGEKGAGANIPPNSTLQFDVELVDTHPKEKDKWMLTNDEKVQKSSDIKERGSASFKKGEYEAALKSYEEALDYLEGTDEWAEQTASQAKPILLSLRLNLTNCNLKLQQWTEATRHATEALKIDSANSKALFRRGVARVKSGFLNEGRDDLFEAAKLEPKDADIRREFEAAKKLLQEVKKKEMNTFGGMFSRVGLYNDKQVPVAAAKDDDNLPERGSESSEESGEEDQGNKDVPPTSGHSG